MIRGRGWTVAGLIVVIGVGAWLLALVPTVGTVLSTGLTAPLHAAAIVTVLADERRELYDWIGTG